MAKLDLKSPPGFNANAGKGHEPKKIRLDEIVIDPDISKIFNIQVKTKEAVLKSILKRGYDPEQPVVIWKGNNILVDGHTRYTASQEAKLEEIFVYERDFQSREDAILYAFGRQAIRRSLSPKEIIKAAQMIPDVRRQKGQGRIADEIAEMLGVSPSTIYQVRKIVKDGSPEDIKSIENGDASINSVYDKLTTKPKEEEFVFTDTMGLPESVKFLRGAVILLVEKDQLIASELLVNHFLKKHERAGFNKLLPEMVIKSLARKNS
jgi:ParB-like chromosome segregation protein Spo0J